MYTDEDTEEQFYTCAWTLAPRESSDGDPATSLPLLDARDSPVSEPDAPSGASPGPPPKDAVLLIVAGFRGIIKLIDCRTCKLVGALLGHGNHVNELMVHPKDPNLLFSASRDESLRMWNLKTRTCVTIFAGEQGHRDQVLSVDVHHLGSSIVSASMDNTIKIWNLDTARIKEGIKRSYNPPAPSSVVPFKTVFSQFPSFSTRRVHTDYVDCVAVGW